MTRRLLLPLALGLLAAGCALRPAEPTLDDLQPATQAPSSAALRIEREQAIAAYREFLAAAPADSPLRANATRRLADLQQATIDEREALAPENAELAEPTPAERNAVINLYTGLLQRYPEHEDNAEILYQLSHAYDADGQRERVLATLDELAARYPDSPHIDEVQFRRGEMYYMDQRMDEAEQAYAAVVRIGEPSVFYPQSLYKRGWALFKLRRYDAALDMFTAVLDRRVVGDDIPLDKLERAERELLDDTVRVAALSFSYQDGAATAAEYFRRKGGRPYEHYVYRTLGAQYQDKERYTDAAATFTAFADSHPLHRHAPRLQLLGIEALKAGRFADRVLEAKRAFIARYGMDQPYWQAFSREQAPDLVAEVKTQLDELSRHYHAQAQRTKKPADYAEAIRWYRLRLAYFPNEADSAESNFLLAELLFESAQYASAAGEYEHAAYDYPGYAKAADAGYAALLAYAAHGKTLAEDQRTPWLRLALQSTGRFTEKFPQHAQAPAVLARYASDLFALGESVRADAAAHTLLSRYPQAPAPLRRSAWLVAAHTAFDRKDYPAAEQGYQQALALMEQKDPQRGTVVERLAAAVYQQGEQQRSAGNLAGAAAQFLRVARVAPQSTVRATAEYDAAAAYLQLQQWPQAIEVLKGFRRNHPGHALQAQVTEKLAVAYLEAGQGSAAAGEFAAIAAAPGDPQVRREAAWRAAELYEKNGAAANAAQAWERYVAAFPQPVPEAIEARNHLLQIRSREGDAKAVRQLREAIIAADGGAGSARTDRTRYLAAGARLALATESFEAYRRIRLTEPLKQTLKRKKAAMKTALDGFGAAGQYAVAEVTTAATYYSAELYRELGRALLESERPKKLSPDELEEYVLLLEEQAFPFEEKAIEVHTINARRTGDGLYDEWVRKSFERLAKLLPARYAKEERGVTAVEELD